MQRVSVQVVEDGGGVAVVVLRVGELGSISCEQEFCVTVTGHSGRLLVGEVDVGVQTVWVTVEKQSEVCGSPVVVKGGGPLVVGGQPGSVKEGVVYPEQAG